jgi:predicted RNA binding protein with dsRBD fold (UPF0201 family)
MNNIIVSIEVTINLTEDLEKVKKATENIFGTLEFKAKPGTGGHIFLSQNKGYETLIRFQDLIKREQIIAAARKIFRGGMTDKSVNFFLNKQVAYAGHISFSQETAESPLGPITVQIKCDNPRKLIDWLAPRPPSKTRKKIHANK